MMKWMLIFIFLLSHVFVLGMASFERDGVSKRSVIHQMLASNTFNIKLTTPVNPVDDRSAELRRFLLIHHRRAASSVTGTDPEPQDDMSDPQPEVAHLERRAILSEGSSLFQRDGESEPSPPTSEPVPEKESDDSPVPIPPTEEKSVGSVVKSVEKKWVKIVEIVVPIAVGIPLLIIIGVSIVLCCKCCSERRRMKDKH